MLNFPPPCKLPFDTWCSLVDEFFDRVLMSLLPWGLCRCKDARARLDVCWIVVWVVMLAWIRNGS